MEHPRTRTLRGLFTRSKSIDHERQPNTDTKVGHFSLITNAYNGIYLAIIDTGCEVSHVIAEGISVGLICNSRRIFYTLSRPSIRAASFY